ncbi:hypothetical protein M446_0193 [Methylobacterium sp. 4-46]|uniref:DUF4214 domain-containing protein n=1 Tax=unclassified Methylobacterium TaxID=2615210 RepID=UPI000152D255|nr:MULTISPECIES: DUF4214 domain-containing protein [Methylobacterium]ACA14768.1 hypothetical protein M446_0193 [Methylobacterium sp. 4-46]WFT80519.1 DUF4214 domain-containing protein [Methylobacterium nodulans]
MNASVDKQSAHDAGVTADAARHTPRFEPTPTITDQHLLTHGNEFQCVRLISDIIDKNPSNFHDQLYQLLTSREFHDAFMRTRMARQSLVGEIFASLLGREPDPSGFDTYSQELTVKSPGQVIAGLLKSDEFKARHRADFSGIDADTLVAAAYTAILEREADPAGVEMYGNALRSGMSAHALLSEFIAMQPAQAAFRQAVVEGLYKSLLGRAPDPVGLEGHSQALATDTPSKVIEDILGSQEFLERERRMPGKTDAATLVGAVYTAILGRDPDPRGIEIYGEALRNGMTVHALLAEFVGMLQRADASPPSNAARDTALEVCTMAREMMIARLVSQGCNLQLGASVQAGGDLAKLGRKTANALLSLQMLA